MSHIAGISEVALRLHDHLGDRSQSPISFKNLLNHPADSLSLRTCNEVDSEYEAHIDGHDDSDESFAQLNKRVKALNEVLLSIKDTAHKLGSSARMYFASEQLHRSVDRIFQLFHKNAYRLFPHKVAMPQTGELSHDGEESNLLNDVTHILKALDAVATDVRSFLGCLNEFPPYNDMIVNNAISEFESDLKYWGSWVKSYQKSENFSSRAIQLSLHDRSVQFGEHLGKITSALERFMNLGVPTIQFTQNHAANNLQNLATIATFLSAVTATTLQFSYTNTNRGLPAAVNGFWFSSLVLSIGAAVNSILGITWKQAMYRSPRSQAPRWVLMWVNHSPIIFLALSVLAFSSGLVLFTFSTSQNPVVCIVTAALTGFCTLGLAALSIWFALERWIFAQYKGEKTLWEIWVEVKDWVVRFTGLHWMAQMAILVHRHTKSMFWRVTGSIWNISSKVENEIRMKRQDTFRIHLERLSSDGVQNNQNLPYSRQDIAPRDGTDLPSLSVMPPEDNEIEKQEGGASPTSPRVRRIANVVLTSVKIRRKRRTQASHLAAPQTNIGRQNDGHRRHDHTVINRLQPETVLSSQGGDGTTKGIKHLRFSPDGKLLAAWEEHGKAVVYSVVNQFKHHYPLQHSDSLPTDIRWSHDSQLILARFKRAILIWTAKDGQLSRKIRCPQLVRCLETTSGLVGDGFLCIEGKNIQQRDYNGAIRDTFSRLTNKVAPLSLSVVPSHKYAIILASVHTSPDGIEPKRFEAERQLIVFDIEQEKVVSRTPALTSANRVQLSSDSKYILVDCDTDRKITQIWRIGDSPGEIEMKHTLVLKIPSLGPGFFAGNQWVVRAAEDGSIYIWDRESGQRIRHIPPDLDGGITLSTAWRPRGDVMLAIGMRSGEIKVWTASMAPLVEEPPEDVPAQPNTPSAMETSHRPIPRRHRSGTM